MRDPNDCTKTELTPFESNRVVPTFAPSGLPNIFDTRYQGLRPWLTTEAPPGRSEIRPHAKRPSSHAERENEKEYDRSIIAAGRPG